MTDTAPTFTDWLESHLGARQWCVAVRLTDRLKAKGYTLAVSQKRFAELEAEYRREQATAKAERITRALFPDDYHDGSDCRSEVDRMTAALTAEGLL